MCRPLTSTFPSPAHLCTVLYMSSISVTHARAALPELLARVALGEEVTLTRHGQPVAVVLHPDTVRVRRASAAIEASHELGRRLDTARVAAVPSGDMSTERAEDLAAAARDSRERG